MPQTTHGNHFKFGRQPDELDTFVVQCGPASETIRSPKQEAIRAAQLIGQAHPLETLQLCLSGGIDSECMLEAFVDAHVPIKAILLRFTNGLNSHDVETGLQLCLTKGISHSILELDVVEFFESGEHLKVAELYQCQSPQLAVHLWMLDQISGVPVMAGNPIVPTWRDDNLFFVGLPGELHSTLFKYFEIRQRAGVPWFFLYTPELTASFLRLPCMTSYFEYKIRSDFYTYAEKCKSYREGGFQAEPRLDKFTGFEEVRKLYDTEAGTKHGTAFDAAFRRPLEALFPFPQRYLQLVPRSYFPVPR